MSTTVTYKGETLTTVSNETVVLETEGTWVEDDFTLTDVTSGGTMQSKSNIDPTTSSQTIEPDEGYDGLSSVQINAMPTGTAGTPTATKGAVSNHSISVTPSVTNSAGYISSGTINGTAVSVSASELDSGAKSITANGNSQDVVGYASVNVNVPNSYSAGDEGKVVSSGALVAQTAHADVTPTTSDQTIDTTTNNSIKVKGDANLVAGNIKKDVEIFGTTGSYEGGGGGTWHKDDDKTHLYIDIPNSVLCDVNLSFTQTISGGHTIDWGDNTTPTTPTSTSTSLISHTYAQAGEYEIVITNTSGYFSLGNTNITKGYIFQETGGSTQHDKYYARPAMLKKMELGKGWDCSKSRQFSNCRQLTEVYVNKKPDQTSFGAYLFDQCRKLISITGVNGWDAGITSCGQNAFSYCPFDVPYIPSNLTAIPNNYITQGSTSYCASALKLDLTGVQTIGSSAFAFLALLSELDIPSSVTQIGASAFNSCVSLRVIHLRRSTPPTLDNANAFSITSSSSHSCVMYVPRGKLTDYQTASNWSTFASYMQEEPS